MNLYKRKISPWKNYLIVIFCVFAVSPFFNTITNVYLLIFLGYLLFVAKQRKVKFFDDKIIKVLVSLYALILIQGFIYKGFSFAGVYTPLIYFYLPYLVYKILGASFVNYYIKVLYGIALFTFPIWLLQSLYPPFDQFLRGAIETVFPYGWGSVPRSLLFYTAAWRDDLFNTNLGIYRNSGLFHEPGAYAVFLLLGVILNICVTGKVFEKKSVFFILCLLSTLSTTGFVTLFVVLTGYLLKMKVNIGIKIAAVMIFLSISAVIYTSGEFLQEKINTQFEDQSYAAQQNLGRYEAESGRFYAFFVSTKLFLEHPFFGRGILYATSEKASGELHEEGSYSYGFTGILSTYGLFFGLFYLFSFYKGFKYFCLLSKQPLVFVISVFIAINLALLTQVFITSTIFVVVFIFGIYSRNPVLNTVKPKLAHA